MLKYHSHMHFSEPPILLGSAHFSPPFSKNDKPTAQIYGHLDVSIIQSALTPAFYDRFLLGREKR